MIAELIGCGIVGGVAGLLLCAAVTSRDDMDAIGILLGAAVAIGIDRVLRS